MGKFGASQYFLVCTPIERGTIQIRLAFHIPSTVSISIPMCLKCLYLHVPANMTSHYKFGGRWFCIFLRWIGWHIHKSKSDYNLWGKWSRKWLYDSLQYKILGKISFSFLKFHKSSFFVPKLSKVLFSSLNFANVSFHPSIYVR